MRIYDHLFFDLDNTLWDFTTNSRLAMEQTLIQNGLIAKLPSFGVFFEVYERINHSLWSDYHTKKITKQNLIVERFSRSMQAFGIDDYNWIELNSLYLENMALQTQLFPGTLETLTTLKSKGYQMHIITNGFKEVQYSKLFNCGLARFFTKVFISEEVKTTKPHREIFEHALKSTNASKKRSIMIGDSWETDITGALEFGMDQIMFLNHGQNTVPESVKLLKLTSNATFLELKPRTKTYFIDEIIGLGELL
ncbi:MAG: YjjG family noncanonical pyrimidine nucleotidase [Prolixibacteraceae bacterium]|nr:YjjG family noncanonical pyrimidine nucleotidase [Prolixibacteraceae bacterium]